MAPLEITLVGYGNQGRAWARNLRDSGWKVRVSGRSSVDGGFGIREAGLDGFVGIAPQELATSPTDLVALLLPDEIIPTFFQKYFGNPERTPRTFIFAHGFAGVYGNLVFVPGDDVILVAPKGIGTKLRENFLAGSGVLGVLGVKQDATGRGWLKARALGEGLGCARVGLVESTFEEETTADLFSEQVLLTGGIPHLLESAVRFMIAKGLNPRLAVYECLHEMKLIVDMMVEHGVEGMFRKVSSTAKFGGLRAAFTLLPKEALDTALEKIWTEIESGAFAKAFEADRKNAFSEMKQSLLRYKDNPMDSHL